MYDIRDLLGKAIAITDRKRTLYEVIYINSEDHQLKLLVKVMILEVEKDKRFYQELQKGVNDENAQEIDFAIYDMISSLINQFVRNFTVPEITSRQDMIRYSLNLEKSLYALMMDIQGRLKQAEGLSDTITYKTLGKMILQKQQTIDNLNLFDIK